MRDKLITSLLNKHVCMIVAEGRTTTGKPNSSGSERASS